MTAGGVIAARASLARGSKSFALAGRLLPRGIRDDAAVVYAWCRRADDAIDLAPPAGHAATLRRLRAELAAIYAGQPQPEPVLRAFQDVVVRCRIPKQDPAELLEGMAMDAAGVRYGRVDELLVYCFRVAGTVGLMMARVMGVHAPGALHRAVDLGLAMQLTNISRDVAEDWERGRLYLPSELLGGAAPGVLDGEAVRGAVAALLRRADELYASGRVGLRSLPLRCAIAIDAAAMIYRAIGREVARRRYDVTAGRAVVPRWKKVLLAAVAVARGVTEWPRRLWRRSRISTPPAPALPAPALVPGISRGPSEDRCLPSPPP